MRLTTKFYASILAVTVLAFLSSALNLLATWQMAILMQEMLNDNLPSVREAEKVESSLLKESEYVDSYIIDNGNRRWLTSLSNRKVLFQQWLTTAQSTTHNAAEVDILKRLENAYQKFDVKRDEVIAFYDKGDAQKAKQVLLEEMNPLRDQVMDSCAEFIGFIEQYIDNATAKAEIRTSHLMWIASTLVGLTAMSGLALLWLFVRGVHIPLRKMAMDVKTFSDVGHAGLSNPPEDEFNAVGFYLRALMTDVTNTRSALHRSIQQTHNAEKLAAVGKLAASVAHEIRNPLIAVKLWLVSIQKKKSDDKELCSNLRMMADEITRLDGLVQDFLEFSRPKALNIEPIQISALLDETLDLVGHRYEDGQINLVRKYSTDMPPIMGDWKQLKQIFINLTNNAAEAMPEGGEIRVLASYIHDLDARPMVLVRIQDTGIGIPEDVQQRLFEPFFTTKESGTGLGLCIAAGIMSRHGGRLALESSNKHGTTFAVWIPAVDGKQDAIASTISEMAESMVKTHE